MFIFISILVTPTLKHPACPLYNIYAIRPGSTTLTLQKRVKAIAAMISAVQGFFH
jgi:hypothetical protein